jgi:hypothetical protein
MSTIKQKIIELINKIGYNRAKWTLFSLVALFSLLIPSSIILLNFNMNQSPCFELLESNSDVFEWIITFGNGGDDKAYDVVQTNDGGFIFTGYISLFNTSDAWNVRELSLLKMNAIGEIQWNRTFGEKYCNAGGYTVIQTSDGGYASSGYITGLIHDDVYFVKTSPNGSLELKQKIGSAKDEERIYSIIQTADGGYMLGGFTDSYYFVGDALYILKLSSNGTEEWYRAYGGWSDYEFECAYSMVETKDGGFALAGYTTTYGSHPKQLEKDDVWLVKVNANGLIQWNKTYGYEGKERAYSLIQTPDGGFVLAGYTTTENNKEDIYIIKTDNNGSIEWSKTHGGKESDCVNSLIQTEDGNLVLTGYTESNCHKNSEPKNRNAIIMKMNLDGKILWDYSIGGLNYDEMNSIIQTSDGDFVLAGYTDPDGQEIFEMWLMRINNEALNSRRSLGLHN